MDAADAHVTEDGGVRDAAVGRDADIILDGSHVDAATDAAVDGGSEPLVVERWGARLSGVVIGMSRIGRALWLGQAQYQEDGEFLENLDEVRVRGGLVRLDLDTGETRVFESELPTSIELPVGIAGPASMARAVGDGERVIAVSSVGLVVIEGDTITSHTVLASGAPATPTGWIQIDRREGDPRLWVGTRQGLVLLDADTFATREVWPGRVGPIALDPDDGAVYIGLSDPTPSLARVMVGAEPVIRTVAGVPMDMTFSPRLDGVLATIQTYDATTGGLVLWNGETVRTLLREGELAAAARGVEGPFGTNALALDDETGIAVVGGQVRDGVSGGGLVWVDLMGAPDARPATFGVSRASSAIEGDSITALSWDPLSRRTFASVGQPCWDTYLGNQGVSMLYFDAGELRVGAALLSTVRDVAVEGERVLVAMRDQRSGCVGNARSGLFELAADRAGRPPAMRALSGEDAATWSATRSRPSRVATLDASHRAVTGWLEPLYVGGSEGVLVSDGMLFPHELEWIDETHFWEGGRSQHFDSDISDDGMSGGATLFQAIGPGTYSYHRYVRGAPEDVPSQRFTPGLPSGDVNDIVIADGGAYLVLGKERMTLGYDRHLGDTFTFHGAMHLGGVVRVEVDGSITTLAEGSIVPDGRAGALDGLGTLHVLDAERGMLRWDGASFVSEVLPLEIPAGSVPHGLMIEGDVLVATYSTGALVRIGETARFIDRVGHAWRAAVRAPGVVLVGTDEGLLRVHPAAVDDPTEAPAPPPGELPPFAP